MPDIYNNYSVVFFSKAPVYPATNIVDEIENIRKLTNIPHYQTMGSIMKNALENAPNIILRKYTTISCRESLVYYLNDVSPIHKVLEELDRISYIILGCRGTDDLNFSKYYNSLDKAKRNHLLRVCSHVYGQPVYIQAQDDVVYLMVKSSAGVSSLNLSALSLFIRMIPYLPETVFSLNATSSYEDWSVRLEVAEMLIKGSSSINEKLAFKGNKAHSIMGLQALGMYISMVGTVECFNRRVSGASNGVFNFATKKDFNVYFIKETISLESLQILAENFPIFNT